MTEVETLKSNIHGRVEFNFKPFLVTYNCFPLQDGDWQIVATDSGVRTAIVSTQTLTDLVEGRISAISLNWFKNDD